MGFSVNFIYTNLTSCQDLLREMEVVENLGFEVTGGSKESLACNAKLAHRHSNMGTQYIPRTRSLAISNHLEKYWWLQVLILIDSVQGLSCWVRVVTLTQTSLSLKLRTGIEKLRESFLGRGHDIVDEELLRQA